MKRIFLLAAFSFVVATQLFAQTKPYNVAFDLTTGDTATHQRVIRWINGIIAGYPDAKIEVVFYGKSLPMVETAQSSVANDVKKTCSRKKCDFYGV